jgi:Sulfite exporter TauE/SafE
MRDDSSSLAAPLLVPAPAPAHADSSAAPSLGSFAVTAAKVTASGAAAGILGIGGGMIMAPMLLSSGVHPQSASATSNVLVFFCSSAATLAFMLAGRVSVGYAGVYGVVCGVASLTGLTLCGRLVAATGRPSIVVLLLAAIMGIGAVCSGVFGALDAVHQAAAGHGGWHGLC